VCEWGWTGACRKAARARGRIRRLALSLFQEYCANMLPGMAARTCVTKLPLHHRCCYAYGCQVCSLHTLLLELLLLGQCKTPVQDEEDWVGMA
jgi:hypothetical protein